MFIEEFETVEVILTTNNQTLRWERSLGFKPKVNTPFMVHWLILKTKKEHRKKFIKVKCDDCCEIFERRIRDLNKDSNYHLCKICQNKGNRNGNYGKPLDQRTKDGAKKWKDVNGNPFTWKSSKEKIKEKNGWLKIAAKNKGKKRTDETKRKMSISICNAYKSGKLKPGNGWKNVKIKQYKGIDYQGTYELRFLKFVDDKNKLHLIERGPKISYFIDGVEHNYFIDYRIKNTNVVFEIKSSYYWEKCKEVNLIKKQEAEKLYEYNLIMNNNFTKLNSFLT